MSAEARDDEGGARRSAHALRSWAEHDRARAIHPVDLAVIDATEAARSLVVELFATAHERDLFSACARLGALMAEAGASPSLAAGAIDSAARAVEDVGGSYDRARIAPARASLVEGYVASVRDASMRRALCAWEYPACAVPLEDSVVAIACGHPLDDGEALAAWAARIAGRLVKGRFREAVLSGPDAARGEVASALELVGIRVRGAREADTAHAPRSWLRLPWRK